MGNLADYIRFGKMFVCTQVGIPKDAILLTSPSATVAKKFPDRTISTEKRLIWDGRRLNIHCPKQDYWNLDAPDIQELEVRAAQIREEYPGVAVVGGGTRYRRRVH